ncbi:CRT-like, chloroquine-resistance transporter-like protein [Nitzschia inconspicua]|uniref:CRT-like, chloroquine-resistance transporter-like protein n=1 Tax=Nitzschia inconspicua TaxID=303405 RepID=A0A9K3KYT5_9STRA|nr:CRT-like, chloroquine-resistance transporter-like protein [Nitzschia inconspicua]
MLRQALDAAEQHVQQQAEELRQHQTTERTPLMSPPTEVVTTRQGGYSSTLDGGGGGDSGNGRFSSVNNHRDYREASDSDDDDDDDYLSEGNDDDWQSQGTSRSSLSHLREVSDSIFLRVWKTIKGCFILVVNVENLWDAPGQGRQINRRNHCVVLLWFVILAASYTAERTTYKLIVDRTGPFRLFSVEMVAFTHALMVGLGMLISAIYRKNFSWQPLGIPLVDVGLMALLDTVHMLLVFLTGYHVAPTLTVILSQFTLPLTALISQFVHPDGYFKRCCTRRNESSNDERITAEEEINPRIFYDGSVGTPRPGCGGLSVEHISGSVIISLAVLLAIFPSIYTLIDRNFFIYADPLPLMTAYNTMLFVSSCIPAAASQLYKEHIFLQYKQPVQPDHLNFILSIFQFIFASIMSPLVYTLLGFAAADDWPTLYPSSDFGKNYGDGLRCFFGTLDEETQMNGYYDDANCRHSLLLVVLYAFSIISIGVAVDKICNAGATKVMYRGVSAGIILAVISLFIYDMHIPYFSYGAAIDSLNLVCLMLLIVGSEVYHRVSLQDATFETGYPEVENCFEEGMVLE